MFSIWNNAIIINSLITKTRIRTATKGPITTTPTLIRTTIITATATTTTNQQQQQHQHQQQQQ
jgi:hypothetical protein